MKALARKVGLVWCMVSLVAALWPAASASAQYTVLPAPTTYWQPASALQISAYQRDTTGEDLLLVEVYNDSDVPITVTDWTISGTFRTASGDTAAAMVITPRVPGVLAPRTHAVIDAGAGIAEASFAMAEWSVKKPAGTLVALTTARAGVTTNEYALKFIAATKTTPAIYDNVWRRTPISSGYSSTLTSFTVSPDGQVYDAGLYMPPETVPVQIVEIYPYSLNCSPFDTNPLCSDYVKVYNPNGVAVTLDDLVLRTDSGSTNRTSSNTIPLDGVTVPAGGYATITQSGANKLALTNSGGYVWFEDTWGLRRYDSTLTQYENAGTSKQGSAWMQDASGTWVWTTTPQPGSANLLTSPVVEVSTSTLGDCPAGKYRNPETNRCRTIEEAVNALAACPEGQTRNAATNRCRSDAVLAKAALTPCKEGQERNPDTNRCRSIASAVADLLPCDEGWERNPDTRRCRKIKATDMPAAAFPVEPIKQTGESALMWWVLGGVGALAVGYAGWEWRREIAGTIRKLSATVMSGKK